MAVQKKHRQLVENCLPQLWQQGSKVSIGTVAPGSLIILEDEGLDASSHEYFLRIVYWHTKQHTKCATTNNEGLFIDYSCMCKPEDKCVVLISFKGE